MFCNNCGSQNDGSSRFCLNCGSPIESFGNNLTQTTQTFNNDNSFVNSLNNFNNQNVQPVVNNVQPAVNNVQPAVNNVPVVENKKPKKEINPKTKKLIFIIAGVILIAAIAICLMLFIPKYDKETRELAKLVDLETPIPVEIESMYTYIDNNGKILSEKRYYSAGDFNGDYAIVELVDGKVAIIDKKQEIKIAVDNYSDIKYISSYGLWIVKGILYDSKLNPITAESMEVEEIEEGFFEYENLDGKESGILNSEGKKLYTTSCIIDSITIDDREENEYYAIVETECKGTEKEYLVELQTGKVLYENKYLQQNEDYYYRLQEDYSGIYYIYKGVSSKKIYLYVENNELIYTADNLSDLNKKSDGYLELDYGYSYKSLGKQQRYYYYDIKNKKVIKEIPETEEVTKKEDDTKEKLKDNSARIVSCNYGKGLINNKKVLVPCIYDELAQLPDSVDAFLKVKKSKELVYISNNDKAFVYDIKRGKEYIVFENAEDYTLKDYASSVLIKQEIEKDSEVIKTNVYSLLTGKKLEFNKISSIEIKGNYFIESRDDKNIYYNYNLEKIYVED